MDVTILTGDCLAVMPTLDADSVDAIVTDPPYSLGFMGKAWDRHADGDDPAFGYYLAGLADGEGCFRIQRHERGTHSCSFSIKLRDDDAAILNRVQRYTGVGTLAAAKGRGGAHDQVLYIVQDKAGCLRIVSLFTRFPLRAKKLRDFLVWADAVVEWNDLQPGHRWSGPSDQSRLAALKERLAATREYREVPWSGHGFQDWCREWGEQALRVLKPGGHMLAFGGSRTAHRLIAGIEDSGFEIRDCLVYLYGAGFPKSLDVSKALDKAAGAERAKVRPVAVPARNRDGTNALGGSWQDEPFVTAPATPLAQAYEGWGTALKPAMELILLARKPLVGTVAQNVAAHGTGGLNIDGCRIETDDPLTGSGSAILRFGGENSRPYQETFIPRGTNRHEGGRWPANVCLDEDAARLLDEASGERRPGEYPANRAGMGFHGANGTTGDRLVLDSGGASRFFYTSKAGQAERWEYLSCDCQAVRLSSWENEDRSPRGPTVSTSPRKGTSGDSSTDECSSPMSLFGSEPTASCPEDSKSTTSTATSRTTDSTTSGSSVQRNTSASTQDANCETERGGSPVASAASSSQSVRQTGISPARAGRSMGVAVPVTSRKSSETNRCAACGKPLTKSAAHPTVKPLDLMQWLCRLVTPKGGLVLDPFCGSGTTGRAAIAEGFRFVGIELDAEYAEIARARITEYAPLFMGAASEAAPETVAPENAAPPSPGEPTPDATQDPAQLAMFDE